MTLRRYFDSNSYLGLTYGSWKLQQLALVERKCSVVEVWRSLASVKCKKKISLDTFRG